MAISRLSTLTALLLILATSEGFLPPTTHKPSAAISTDLWFTTQHASESTPSSTKLFGFFNNLLPNPSKSKDEVKPAYELVTIDQDFRVAGLFLSLGALLDTIPYIQLTLGPVVTLLGLLFLVQTFRLRFQFTEDNNFQLVTVNPLTGELEDSGENVIVGGANCWKCDTIVNYDFFPVNWIDSNPIGPILVYFKETQTPEDKWNEGPGESANDPEKIAAGIAVPGQVHFFPAVANAEQIRSEFEKRQCSKI